MVDARTTHNKRVWKNKKMSSISAVTATSLIDRLNGENESKSAESNRKLQKCGETSNSPLVHEFSDLPEMLMAKLNEQRKNSVMCNVTVVTADGRSFRAHKSVLAACSRYLEAELSSISEEKMDSKSEAIVHLGMISSASFETLLDLVYTSKLILSEKNVSDVLLAADILDLEQVGALCRQFLRSQIKSKSVPRDNVQRSLSSDADINNNLFGFHKKNQRGGSKDSTASSSSGFSSCSSSTSSQRELDLTYSCIDEPILKSHVNVEESNEKDSFRLETRNCENHIKSSSIPDLPSCTVEKEVAFVKDRPSSAPTSHSSSDFDGVTANKRKREESESQDPYNDQDAQKMTRSSLPPKLLNVSSVPDDSLSRKLFTSEEDRFLSKTSPDLEDFVSDHSHYRVKSEVSIIPRFYPQTDFSAAEDLRRYQPSEGDRMHGTEHVSSLFGSKTSPLSTSSENASPLLSQALPNLSSGVHFRNRHSKSQDERLETYRSDIPPNARLQAAITRTHSSDPHPSEKRGDQGTQSGFVNLNASQFPHRRKVKSDESQSPYEKLYNSSSMVPHHSQGIFQDTSQFLASLYMLRTQALNPAGFFNSAYSLQNRSHSCDGAGVSPGQHHHGVAQTVENASFAKRQLQHSNSVVTSSALICKLCKVEFASEWSLSMHHRLYHPFDYLYQPQPRSPTEGKSSDLSITSTLGSEQNGLISPKPFPLMRSTSSPCKLGMIQDKNIGTRSFDLAGVGETLVSHKCYHCKKEFPSIFLLRKHKATEHMKRPYKCQRCNAAFPNKAGLSVHLRSHTGERPYRCKVCDKAFTQLGHVQRHQKVHTGEKPYQCPLCQARVRDKASMHYHILAHQGVKPFKCDQCDARFTKRSSLVKHKNVHTGAFLYQCPQCKASFREKASLSRHVRSQHKEPCFTASLNMISPSSLDRRPLSPERPSNKNDSPVNLTMDSHVDVVKVQ